MQSKVGYQRESQTIFSSFLRISIVSNRDAGANGFFFLMDVVDQQWG